MVISRCNFLKSNEFAMVSPQLDAALPLRSRRNTITNKMLFYKKKNGSGNIGCKESLVNR
jgi:hypothetical protein